MSTLVYAPGVRAFIDTAKYGIIDVTDDLMSGQVTLNENSAHMLSLRLENPHRKYDGIFMPNDRIVLRLKRIRWLQIFSGYLNRVPFASTWPRVVDISAACTLKKLLYRFYDPGAIATTNLMSSFSPSSGVAPTSQPGTDADGNLSARAVAVLEQIGDWPLDAIHIGRLPPEWFESISGIFATISPQLQAVANLVSPGGTIAGLNVGDVVPDALGFVTDEQAVKAAYAGGFRGDSVPVAGAVAFAESTLNVAADNSASYPGVKARGLMQISSVAHPSYDVQRLLSDPIYNMTAAWEIAGSPADGEAPNWGPWEAYGNARYNEALPRMRAAWAALQTGATSTTPTTGDLGQDLDGAINAYQTRPAGAPQNLVFPVPGAQKASETINGVLWGYTDDWGNPRSGGRTHKGHDIFGAMGTPVLSMSDGVATRVINSEHPSAGLYVEITDSAGARYRYLHNQTNLVTEGQRITAGQQIATLGDTGNARGGSPHVHFEWWPDGRDPVNPHSLLNSAAGISVPAGSNSGPGMLGSVGAFPTPDELSNLLIGPRALLNDTQPLFNTVKDLLNASMRSFCSAPNGDIIAWFPDYFGNYGLTGVMTIEDIELQDFTIDWSDERLVTHQFVTGSVLGYDSAIPEDPGTTVQRMVSTLGVATIDFPEILEAILGPGAGAWTDPGAILARFGARPDHQNIPAIVNPEAEFFFAVYLFMRAWAQQFSATIPISFMPELWPGMLMKIPSQGIQVYCEQVTHTFDFREGGGFETHAQITAPASLNGRFADLPQAGAFKESIAELAADFIASIT